MSQPVGLWLIGARGGVATVAATGLETLKLGGGGSDSTGLVTELQAFQGLDLIQWDQVVIGGHEIRSGSILDEAREFQRTSRAFSETKIDSVESALASIDDRVRPGILHRSGSAIDQLADDQVASDQRTVDEKVAVLEEDLREFKQSNGLGHVVVINVSSTETPVDRTSLPARWSEAEKHLDAFPVSSLYAIAAMRCGCSYVNFTPSLGTDCEALCELAAEQNVAHAGRDGKTGETLIKSALAPAFAMRNLDVMSWVGHNIFGNMDGQVLDDPVNKKTKVDSKDGLLSEILGYQPQSHISIEYIKSLGDWKTAWDHIHFKGFMGTPMVMQFTWQGCDSILAAPLVLDLFRLTERAVRAGQGGVLDWLACFFKSPMGVNENNLVHQFAMLEQWAAEQAKVAH